tara:strand:- start:99 stop:728 length:630 start_codon:yes stop_codon:yes gene_type:complete
MNKKIVIIGCGALSKETYHVVKKCNREFFGFLSFESDELSTFQYKDSVICNIEKFSFNTDYEYLCIMGTPKIKHNVFTEIKDKHKVSFASLVHPNANIDGNVSIGEGTVITAGVSITDNVKIGENCYINLNSTIGHDTCIEESVVINPGCLISGKVEIGSCALIGTGACIKQDISIGSNTLIGMGSVQTKNAKANSVYFGNPSKFVKEI